MSTLKIDHESPVPLHSQVEDLLRGLIKDPEYQNGKLLPNEVDIAKRLGIARNTVRQATNKLVYENLLVRKKGVGTKVARNNITTKLNKWSSFTHEMSDKGVPFITHTLKVSWGISDKQISEIFGIPNKTKVLKLERIRGLKSGPIVYFISYFHPRVGLTGKEDFSWPLYEMLEKEYHTVAAVSKEDINAIVATRELSMKLDIKEDSPVLFRRRIVCDPGGRPIEYNLGYYRADSFTYTIDIERG